MPSRFYTHYIKRFMLSLQQSCIPCCRNTVALCILLAYATLLSIFLFPEKWQDSAFLSVQSVDGRSSGQSQPSANTKWSMDYIQRKDYYINAQANRAGTSSDDKMSSEYLRQHAKLQRKDALSQEKHSVADGGPELNSEADVEIPGLDLETTTLYEANLKSLNHDRSQDDEGDDLDAAETAGKEAKRAIYINPHPKATNLLHFNGCSHSCQATNSTEDADLVIFNAAQMHDVPILPEKRPNQIWLMISREAAPFQRFAGLLRDDVKGVINWTAAIYTDATFQMSHGQLRKGELPDRDYDAIFDRKRFDVAWFVSHCETPSRREEYVKRMTPYIDIHVFGWCGNMTCGGRGYTMGGQLDLCMKMLSKDYKFYLSFENALCDEYLSEKFFNLFKANVDIIPVVRTGADYSSRFPSDIVIDTRDFQSPEKLAKYLKQLSHDKARYVKILKAKSRYKMYRNVSYSCSACKALHDGLPSQVLEDPYKYFANKSARCHEPRDLD